MSTTITVPIPPLPDDAYLAFKQAEGTLTADQGALTSANAALTAAQTAQAGAQSTVSNDTAVSVAAANTLIASLQTYVNALTPTTSN